TPLPPTDDAGTTSGTSRSLRPLARFSGILRPPMPLAPESRRERFLRRARVHLSFIRVNLRQFWVSLLVFFLSNGLGGLVIFAETEPRPTLAHAFFTAFTLTFFQVNDPYP